MILGCRCFAAGPVPGSFYEAPARVLMWLSCIKIIECATPTKNERTPNMTMNALMRCACACCVMASKHWSIGTGVNALTGQRHVLQLALPPSSLWPTEPHEGHVSECPAIHLARWSLLELGSISLELGSIQLVHEAPWRNIHRSFCS